MKGYSSDLGIKSGQYVTLFFFSFFLAGVGGGGLKSH